MLTNEESQFNKTIDQGLLILADMEREMQEKGEKVLDGQQAFKLYDTYGFPVDLTKEILEEKGYAVDEDGFRREMEEQRERARKGREVTNYMVRMRQCTTALIRLSRRNLTAMERLRWTRRSL